MFKVTITDPAYAGGKPIKLITPRTGADVVKLRAKYAHVDAEPVGCVVRTELKLAEPSDPPAPRPTAPKPNDFQVALHALVHLYGTAKKRGDLGLAARAEDACAALLGSQPFLKGDDGKPFAPKPIGSVRAVNHTLAGIGKDR